MALKSLLEAFDGQFVVPSFLIKRAHLLVENAGLVVCRPARQVQEADGTAEVGHRAVGVCEQFLEKCQIADGICSRGVVEAEKMLA